MGRGRYGETNDEQSTGSEAPSQPESSNTETIETQTTSEEPTQETPPTTQTSKNISDVILENTDPNKGFLTSSGTYVNIYKNAGDTERTYTSDNTVKPQGQRIDPSSSEGQVIQNQYAEQADRRVDNSAQNERFWAIREGQGSVKDVLYDSQSAEQRRLTDIFFEERNLDINTPLNQLSLSPKRYATAREQLTTGENIPKDGVTVPDSIWLKTDTPTKSELKSFEEYRSNIITKATTPSTVRDKITAISEGAEFTDSSYNTYDVDTKTWNPTPIDDKQKQSAKELVDDARAQGFKFITITKQRVGVPDSTITIPIDGTNAYSKIENEFRKSNVYGQANDQVSIVGHIDKNILPLPEDETTIPMIDGVPYLLGGSLLFAQLIKNKDTIPVGDTSGEINQSYESWRAGEAPSTFSQVFTEDAIGTKISDYRQRPELGYLSVGQQLGAIVQGGLTGKLDETEFMDTALDSGIRVLTAFGDPNRGTSSQIKEGARTAVGGTYSGGGGLEGMIKQFEIESKLWDAYGGYYVNSAITEIGLIAVTGGATAVARLSGRVGVGAVAQALKISPALSTANQLKLAKVARQLTRGSIAVPMNLVFGGLGKTSGKITLESIQKMTEVEAEAYGYGTLRKVVVDDPLLRNFDVTPENKIKDNLSENQQLEDQTRVNQIDEQNYAEMGRTSQEGGAYDAGYSSQLADSKLDGTDLLSQGSADEKILWQAEGFEGFPQLVTNPYTKAVDRPSADGAETVGLPVFYRDPISTQSPLMREVNFGKSVSDGDMEGIYVANFAQLRNQPLTVRGDPNLIQELKFSQKSFDPMSTPLYDSQNMQRPKTIFDQNMQRPKIFKDVDDTSTTTLGMYEDMVNTPLGFIDAQGVRVTGRETTDLFRMDADPRFVSQIKFAEDGSLNMQLPKAPNLDVLLPTKFTPNTSRVKNIEQALPQSDIKIGDDFIDYKPLEKLPPTTVSEFKIQDNMIRFKLHRGTEEYISTSYIDPKTKNIRSTSLTGINWSSFNPAKQTFINPSQTTIKTLMLVPETGYVKDSKNPWSVSRFGNFTDKETGVWQMPINPDQKLDALMIKYMLESEDMTRKTVLKDGKLVNIEETSSDVKNIFAYKSQLAEIDMLKETIKDKKSKRYKYFNNLYAPFKSKTKNVLTNLKREQKAERIEKYKTGLKEDEILLTSLEKKIDFSKTSAEKSALKLWEVDVNRMFVEQQTLRAKENLKSTVYGTGNLGVDTKGATSIATDPYFYNAPKSLTAQEKKQIAQVTADARYHDLAQDDFYNIEKTIGRALSGEEADYMININRLDKMVDQDVLAVVTEQRSSPAFGKSVIEYIRNKRVIDESAQQFTPTLVTLTDDFTQVTMGVNSNFADTSKKLFLQSQVTKAEKDLRMTLLNIQGNEANFQLSTTGISTPIRESMNMQGRQTEWTNPLGDSGKAMELNIRDKEIKILEQKELQKELDAVNFQLAGIKDNVEIQKSFEFNSELISTRQEPVTPQQLEDYLRIRDEATAKLSAFPEGRPVVEKLDSSQGKPTGTKSDNTISDISRIKPSTVEDVTGGYSDPDRGFVSDVKGIEDLMRMVEDDKIINPQETATVSDLLWKQEVPTPKETGTGKDGVVDTGKKSDTVLEQMKRIEEQKLDQWKYDQAKSAQIESNVWLENKFKDIADAKEDLKNFKKQAKVQSDGVFNMDSIGNNPINPQKGVWNNRIDTPESEYMKLLVKKENLDEQSTIINYQLVALNKKIGNVGGVDKFGNYNKASGIQADISTQQYLAINKILNFEEADMLRQASKGDYVNVPVKSDKQEKHFTDQYRVQFAKRLDGSPFSGGKITVRSLVSSQSYKKGEELEAINDLLERYNKIRKARGQELSTSTPTVEFASGSGYTAIFDEKGSLNVQRPFATSNVNMQIGNVVPKFMTVKEPVALKDKWTVPRVLEEGQVRQIEYVQTAGDTSNLERRETFINKKTGDVADNTTGDIEITKEYKKWSPFQKGYTGQVSSLETAIKSKENLTARSFELDSMYDNIAFDISNTSPDITSRVFLDQVAPDKRKLAELTLLRRTTENKAYNLKLDMEKNLEEQQMLDVAKLKITEPDDVAIQSMTPLGGQFTINSKGLSDMEARQLSYVLPQIGNDPQFRTIKNIFENNERYKKTVLFENVYRDSSLTLKEPENFTAEQLQAWNKVKDIEAKYDHALGIRYKIGGGTDNVPTQTDTVLKEIESMISTPRKYIGKKDNPNLGSQTNYGETSNIYNIQTRQLDETMYKVNTDGTPNPLDTTDPKLVAKYEKDFLQQLKSKYQSHEKLTVKADKLNEQRNELVAQLSKLEDGKPSPTYTGNIYNTKKIMGKKYPDSSEMEVIGETPERIDSKPLERIKGFFKDGFYSSKNDGSVSSQSTGAQIRSGIEGISVGIKKDMLDNKIASTQNKITKIDEKLMKLDSKVDEVALSGMDSFLTNTNVRNYDPLLRVDNDVRWMKDEGSGLGKGFDPDDVDPKGNPLMVNPKPKNEEKSKTTGVDNFKALQRILDRNAVSTAYGQTPLPFLPITTMRYPATAPQDIQDNVELQQVPNTEYVPPQPQMDVKPDTRGLDPFTPQPVSGFESIKPIMDQGTDLGNVLSNANALKLGIYPKALNQGALPKFITNPPIQTPIIKQGNILNLYPVTTPKPLSMTGVGTAPIVPVQPRQPIPLPVWNQYIPPTKKPRRKKTKPKKVKKRKIYWDVSSSPFKPFNPKEYYTFKNEPRSVKFKEKRKSLD